jgi:hypothetical protein
MLALSEVSEHLVTDVVIQSLGCIHFAQQMTSDGRIEYPRSEDGVCT